MQVGVVHGWGRGRGERGAKGGAGRAMPEGEKEKKAT